MRKDNRSLEYVSGKLEEIYPSITDIYYNQEEDYNIDLQVSAATSTGVTEVKSISTKYGPLSGDYWVTGSTTNNNWRWCVSGTQESIAEDTTPYPEEMKGKRLIMLNEYKYNKLNRVKGGLVYLAQDGLLIFSNRQLNTALAGKGWLLCRKTKEFGDRRREWEHKVLLDMTKGTYHQIDDVPLDLLK